MFAEVLVELNFFDNKFFSYSIPSNMKVILGSRVKIPFNNRVIEGIVINITDKIDIKVKDIIEVIDEEPLLNKELLELGKYMSETYISSLMSCYKTMLPIGMNFSKQKINPKTIKYIQLIKESSNLSIAEQNIIEKLKNSNLLKSEILNKKALSKLLEKKLVKEIEEEISRSNIEYVKYKLHELNENQKKIVNEFNSSKKEIFLLRGITGSGKTEIYINLIKQTLEKNKTAIILVPEISLTAQLIGRFKSVFEDSVAVIHSGLTNVERYDEYIKIKKQEAKIVIGARSAIFAPLENLGIIIIDEEHEDSYKQDNNPRYNALDIAIFRIKYNNCKLLLGSATPSLESYARSKTNKYHLLELLERVNKKPLPKITVVDMKEEYKKKNPVLSNLAKLKIEEKLQKKEQIMILLNRRGYSNYLICNECSHVIKCPNCDISLTYHKKNDELKCHYCEYSIKKIYKCVKCNSKHLTLKGSGTEKIEEFLNTNFNVKTIRMDRDTTSKKNSHFNIIKDFNEKKYDILLGTQMIAKGLDFPNVTLVIVLSGDSSLNFPDYKSSEKTFQLLTQVSGRSGREQKQGEVIIQTFNSDHYAIDFAKNHDYLSFYNQEMHIRKKLNYPPFCFLVAVRIISEDYDLGLKNIEQINNYLRKNLTETILGPSESLKIQNTYKFQIIIKYKDKENIYKILNEINNIYKNKKVKLEIDFNPNRL